MGGLTPRQRYREDLAREGFVADSAQAAAVDLLDALLRELVDTGPVPPLAGPAAWWRRLRGDRREAPEGLYLWGGVGRGKTYLMDTFYDCLPFADRERVHFHRFMQRVHRDLRALAGEKNPLDRIADDMAGRARVLCFDEFFVSDIADAMILGHLMTALFERGITLVATSNLPPQRLYENGLQRQRFLPAIRQIETHTRVVNVDGGVDYRLRTLEQAQLYYHPCGEFAQAGLRESFEQLAPEPGRSAVTIEVNDRLLHALQLADDVAWFSFSELCEGPRSQNDYIELARLFHAVIVSGVPRLGGGRDDAARRFINLVDEFYDRRVKLVLEAECPLDALYTGGNLAFEFQRTVSRLREMQTHDYLALEHLP
jgi:cell division protein ZapE